MIHAFQWSPYTSTQFYSAASSLRKPSLPHPTQVQLSPTAPNRIFARKDPQILSYRSSFETAFDALFHRSNSRERIAATSLQLPAPNSKEPIPFLSTIKEFYCTQKRVNRTTKSTSPNRPEQRTSVPWLWRQLSRRKRQPLKKQIAIQILVRLFRLPQRFLSVLLRRPSVLNVFFEERVRCGEIVLFHNVVFSHTIHIYVQCRPRRGSAASWPWPALRR